MPLIFHAAPQRWLAFQSGAGDLDGKPGKCANLFSAPSRLKGHKCTVGNLGDKFDY